MKKISNTDTKPDRGTPRFLLDVPLAEWPRLVEELGEPAFRAGQLAEWVFKRRATRFSEMSNLPAPLRTRLEAGFFLRSLEVERVERSRADGTARYALSAAAGGIVSCVYLPFEDLRSLCLSTQVGCAWGCVFCASGRVPFARNLSAGEMLEQILLVEAVEGARLDSILFMGMGEPLANIDALLAALGVIRSQIGLNIGARHVTVSTCGLVPQILRLAKEAPKVNLAVSLHAVSDDVRQKLLPRAARWSIKEVLFAAKTFSRQTGSRVTFEYILLKGVNDAEKDAKRLANLLRGPVRHGDYWVNLIAYNPVPGLSFSPPDAAAVEVFKDVLRARGVPVRLRKPQGVDITAGCGQLGEARRFSSQKRN